jgi:hypothetical protein
LADASNERFAGLPSYARQRKLAFAVGDRAGALSRDVDADRTAKAELVSHRGDAVDADPSRGFVEINVAGFLDPVMQAQRPMALLPPAMEGSVAERQIAGAAERYIGRDGAGLERRQCHDWLECRSGRIDAGDCLVGQRVTRVG